MARLPRLSLAGQLHHVIQRGNNRQAVFVDAQDYERMLSLLEENVRQFRVAVHAYVLMGNHFHWLLTPSTDDALAQTMQAVGRSYVRYFNDRHHRSGTLWEGRYRSTIVQAERYLLPCMVYIDQNPVRAGLVGQARDYAWSSHAHYLGLRSERLITPHALFWRLGNTPFAREAAYDALVQADVASHHQQALTDATLSGWALGDAAFMQNLQTLTSRRITPKTAGRPPAARIEQSSDMPSFP